jgi:hypothetical protein
MSDEFDPAPYLRPPVIDVASGVELGVALLSAMPKSAPDGVRKAATKLRMATVGLQDAWSWSEKSATPGEKRMADIAIDNAWSALHARLDAYASLPQVRWPRSGRAAELAAILFPDGLAFLSLPYADEWREGERRLKSIDELGLAKDISELAGPEFLVEVRQAQALYGEVLAVAKPNGVKSATDLTDPLRALTRAVSAYAIQVIAMADGTQETTKLIRQVLRPIDEHRSALSSRRGAADAGAYQASGTSTAVGLGGVVPEVKP